MAKYNIYKIIDTRGQGLSDRLLEKGYKLVAEVDSGSYVLTSYFTPTPSSTDVWWLEQYGSMFPEHENNKNLIYSGAIVATPKNGGGLYIIAFGKTHFYIQSFIEVGFGLDLAEHIADVGGGKMKSSKNFAGITGKTMTSFTTQGQLRFSSGEATDYVKLKARDKQWGSGFIHFGTSVQFGNLEEKPEQLGAVLDAVEASLRDDSQLMYLPRMLQIKDLSLIQELDSKLAKLILDDQSNQYVGVVDYELYGVDFVFSQATHCKLKCGSETSSSLDELSLNAIREFAKNSDVDLKTQLRDIKVQVLIGSSSKFTVPLLNLIDYMGDDQTFLYRGKWHVFNKSFIDALKATLEDIECQSAELSFYDEEHESWKKANPKITVNYPERYIIEKLVKANPEFVVNDRLLEYLHSGGKRYAVEVSDLVDRKSKRLIVVKRGSAKDFSYAFNQAFTTLNLVNNNKFKLSSGESIQVNELELYLASTRATTPTKIEDVESLNFQIQLNELYMLAAEKRVRVIVTFAKYAKKNSGA